MWSSESEALESQSKPARLVASALQQNGFFSGPLQRVACPNLIQPLEVETFPDVDALTIAQQRWLLNLGWYYTQFLTAPIPLLNVPPNAVLWPGALMNLIVVLCDRLLDLGIDPELVQPAAEVFACGGDRSALMALLQRFRSSLDQVASAETYFPIIRRVLPPFFEAQRMTMITKPALAYRFWLRKSVLPWLAMVIPALCRAPRASFDIHRYLRWLYSFGRFVGAVDDAADWDSDLANDEPNWWRGSPDHTATAQAVGKWGTEVILEWDRLCGDRHPAVAPRLFFTQNIADWLRA